jgi:hypothetical protein
MKKLVTILVVLFFFSTALYAQTAIWSPLGIGLNSNPNAIGVLGNKVYVGGTSYMSTAGETPVHSMAIWNGTDWSALLVELDAGSLVATIAVSGTDVYVAGSFTTISGLTVNNIAKWNGTSWSALGIGGDIGLNAGVRAIAISGNKIVVGGTFSKAGSYGIAMYDIGTSTWSGLGTGVDHSVHAVAIEGSNIYAGGEFTNAGESSANYIAKWNGSAWSALSSGVSSWVEAIAVSGSDVYVGGQFTAAGGSSANYIAKWNGSAWSALGTGVDAVVWAIAISGTDVYVGGDFTTANGTTTVNRIAKWNGSTWSALGNGVDNLGVYALAVYPANGTMIVGGAFGFLGDGVTRVNFIAQFTDPDNPLPIELTTFAAKVNGYAVSLKWQTATELNNYGFEVERRSVSDQIENATWSKVGFVQGSGTSNAPKEYTFSDTDTKLAAGRYAYRLKQVDNNGTFKYSQSAEVEIGVAPKVFALNQNYPNPFNPSTTINFTLAEDSYVSLRVFDMLGREVQTLVNGEMKAGEAHSIIFDASKISSGLYFYRLETGKSSLVKKLMLLK